MEKSSLSLNQNKFISFADSNGILIVKYGRKNNKIFNRYKVSHEQELLSFSIQVKAKGDKMSKELCLQASTKDEMDRFIENLKLVI